MRLSDEKHHNMFRFEQEPFGKHSDYQKFVKMYLPVSHTWVCSCKITCHGLSYNLIPFVRLLF